MTCSPLEVEVGKGWIVAESTSPVGKGTAGLLFMNGMPPLRDGPDDGEFTPGAGLGESSSRGRKGHGNDGDDDTMPPAIGSGAPKEGKSGDGGDAEGRETCTENF